MKRQAGIKALSAVSAACVAVFLMVAPANAAPHDGDEFQLSQPDGSLVPVLVWGDEFQQTVESPDGFTLIRDAAGWICYAELSAGGSEYVATGVRYTGPASSSPVKQKKLRINSRSYLDKHRRAREAVGFNEDEMVPEDRRRGKAGDGASPAPAATQMVGLAVLIDFSDQTTALQPATMETFFNRVGADLTVNATGGSVYDWFYSVSNGELEYTNIVPPAFVRADSAKTYYDRGTNYQYVPALLQCAFTKIKAMAESGQLDLSRLSYETGGSGNNQTYTLMAVNVYYAGSATQGWSNGIWPHQGTYRAPTGQTAVTFNVGGRTLRIGRYQLSSLGTGANAPGIGTTVHENGHMIMRWPDLYNYDATVTNVVSSYCVMSSSNGSNPQMPNPQFRERAGWVAVTNITNMNATLTHEANSPMVYHFVRNAQESYYIEARRRSGRSSNIPGEGLIIWHVHTSGQNTSLRAANPYPLVKVVQANNANSTTDNNTIPNFPTAPGANAPFRAGGGSNNTAFHATTAPPARYYDGQQSPMRITAVSSINTTVPNPTMSFTIGNPTGPAAYLLDVAGGTTGSGLYRADTTVRIGASLNNAAGRGFVRWSADTLSPALAAPANIYACTTTVRTVARSATVTANYGRIMSLPGIVEADTFGFASGVASATQNGATGNRAGRFTGAGSFTEYAVNVASAGSHTLSYSVLALTGSASGRFTLRNVTNNTVLDTIILPNITGNTASLRTVTGKTVELSAGRQVWRLEAIAMSGANISMDNFTVSGTTPVIRNTLNAVTAYDIRAVSSGKITFHVPAAEHVSLKMYDVKGRMVATLCDGMRNQGVYSVNIAGRNAALGQGVYIVRMKSGVYSRDIRVNYRK